ncbi:MAG: putative porin [Bacteroidota bacterium]
MILKLLSLKNDTFATVFDISMNRAFLLVGFLLMMFSSFAQQRGNLQRGGGQGQRGQQNQQQPNTQTVKAKKDMPPATDYKRISVARDTVFVDTTLSIAKQYKANFLRQDNFELIEGHNVGMAYNRLGYDFSTSSLMPGFGASGKHFNYLGVNDVFYNHVPTPLTEIYFRTVLEQGQNIKTLFTTNVSPRLNLTIGYEALNSLGHYVHSRSTVGSFQGNLSYRTENDRYHLRLHITKQDLTNEQNGGMTPNAIEAYQNQVEELENRTSVEVQHRDGESNLIGRRLYFDQFYKINKGDSTQNNQIRLAHSLKFEERTYKFQQGESYDIYGNAYQNTDIDNRAKYSDVTNTASLSYQQNLLGEFAFKAQHAYFNYGYNSVVVTEDEIIPSRLNGDVISIGGTYKNQFGPLDLEGELMHNLVGDFDGSFLKARAGLQLSQSLKANANLNISSQAPDFNMQMFQSAYTNYNWITDFNNIQKQYIGGNLVHDKYGFVEASLTQIRNHAYFGVEEGTEVTDFNDLHQHIKPLQASDRDVRYLKLKAGNEFNLGIFGNTNTVMYQNVFNGDDILPTPDFVTRNSFYYQDYWFNKATFIQTGITFKYFTDFNSMAFNPILNEFVIQDLQTLDGFYTLDVFFNAKIRSARLFFNLDNITTLFEGNNNFASPAYPFRDFTFRFGIVWDLFL